MRRHVTLHQTAARCALGLTLANLLGQAACSEFTEVSAPDVVQPASLATPLGAEVLRAGAVAAFAIAYGGSGPSREGQILSSGTFADEFTSTLASTGGADVRTDQRNVPDPGDLHYPYARLQAARVSSLQALGAMKKFAPQAVAKIAQLYAQTGYVELFFAENLCSGVPLSSVTLDGDLTYGPALTTAQLFTRAGEDFDSAAKYAVDSVRVLNMVRVARGRSLLQQGRFAEAAMAVAAVPTNFSFVAEYSATQTNGVFQSINTDRTRTVSDQEGTNGLNFRTANDPRVPSTANGAGADGTPIFTFGKYNSSSTSIPLAGGIEARLIESEAAYQANPNDASTTGSGWLGILNALRATAITPALAPLADPGSPAARATLLFRERAFWLFGTGHRHGDLRRLVRQYGRLQDQVFPTGSYKGQALYGSDVTFTVSTSEGPNPQWSGKCLNRDP